MPTINGTTVQKMTAYLNGTSYPALVEYANKDGYGNTINASTYWNTTQPLGNMSLVDGGLAPKASNVYVSLGTASLRFANIYGGYVDAYTLMVNTNNGNGWGLTYYSAPMIALSAQTRPDDKAWEDGINFGFAYSGSLEYTDYWLRPVLYTTSFMNASQVGDARFVEYSGAIYTYARTEGDGAHYGRAELQGNLMVVYDLVFGSCAYLYSQAINFD